MTKQGNILYFTSDTHRIYKGSTLIAADFSSDVELTPKYADEWTVSLTGAYADWHVRSGPTWQAGESLWTLTVESSDGSQGGIGADQTSPSDALSLSFYEGAITATRQSTAHTVVGYQLGSQDDKPLATAAQGAKADTAI